jgi:hypothetical protein
MFFLVEFYFGAEICLENCEVAVFETRDGFQVFEKLHSPVARIVLRLVFDVVAPLAVPRAHADIFWNDVNRVGETKGRG